jgi:hypothetical protein
VACRAYYQQQYNVTSLSARRQRRGGKLTVAYGIDDDYCDDDDEDDEDEEDDDDQEDCDEDDCHIEDVRLSRGASISSGRSRTGGAGAIDGDCDDDDDEDSGVSPKEVRNKYEFTNSVKSFTKILIILKFKYIMYQTVFILNVYYVCCIHNILE